MVGQPFVARRPFEAHGTTGAVVSILIIRSSSSILVSGKVGPLVCPSTSDSRYARTAQQIYNYWIGGTLRLLGRDYLLHQEGIQNVILSCQAPSHIGGFSKVPGSYPDILHSLYSLAWLRYDKTES